MKKAGNKKTPPSIIAMTCTDDTEAGLQSEAVVGGKAMPLP